MRACFFKWICNFSYFSPTLIKFRSKAEIVIGLVPEMMMNLSSSPILVNQTKVRLTFLIIFNSNQLAKMKNICNIRALFCTFAFTTGDPKKKWLSEFFMTGQVSAGSNHYQLRECVNIEKYHLASSWPVIKRNQKVTFFGIPCISYMIYDNTNICVKCFVLLYLLLKAAQNKSCCVQCPSVEKFLPWCHQSMGNNWNLLVFFSSNGTKWFISCIL